MNVISVVDRIYGDFRILIQNFVHKLYDFANNRSLWPSVSTQARASILSGKNSLVILEHCLMELGPAIF